MRNYALILASIFALAVGACDDDDDDRLVNGCREKFVRVGDLCRRCPAGSEPEGSRCVALLDASPPDPELDAGWADLAAIARDGAVIRR